MVETLPTSEPRNPARFRSSLRSPDIPAIKIYVRHEGWYRVTQPELVQAGLDPNRSIPSSLHLYAEAVRAAAANHGRDGGSRRIRTRKRRSISTAQESTLCSRERESTGSLANAARALRIPQLPASSGLEPASGQLPATVELQQRTIYFAALLTKDGQNFFGALVSPTPVDQVLDASAL